MNQAADSRVRVMLLFGGRSGEHPISCVTAGSILREIDRDRFEPVPVGVTRDGRWTLVPDSWEDLRIQDGRLPEVAGAGPEVVPPARAGSREWRLLPAAVGREPFQPHAPEHGPGLAADPRVCAEAAGGVPLGPIDVVFPLFHGPFGEDGTVQGLLELTDQRYVGSGVLASALGMDKGYAKCVLGAHGLRVAPYTVVTAAEWASGRDAVLARAARLGFPLFVKPCRAGSSLGISKARDAGELADGIGRATAHDPRVLVEQAMRGREIECAVLGTAPPRTSLPAEIAVLGGHEFYDFEAKYLDASGAELICPADLPHGAIRAMREAAVRAFEALGAEGLARVDFFWDAEAAPGAQLTVNEVNTMPGFTPISQYPRMWQATGLGYTELITELIELALRRPVGLR